MLGIDYASVDGNHPPDFAAAFDYGIRFVVIRGAYTYNGINADPTVARDAPGVRAAGMQFGAYLILGWQDDPAAQVAKFVEVYGNGSPGDLPPSLDVEFPQGIGPTGLTAAAALAKIETAITALKQTYPTVMIYTSARVWQEDLNNIASDLVGTCPAWLKVPYPWKAGNPPHIDNIPALGTLPPPWQAAGSPGCYIEQFQGDAKQVPGMSSTVDLNTFLIYTADLGDARTRWICGQLAAAGHAATDDVDSINAAIRAFQTANNLTADGAVGPDTWAVLCVPPLTLRTL